MTQKSNFLEPKLTLAKLSIQLLFPQGLQHNSQVLRMLYLILGVNQDVVNEYNDKLIQIWPKDSIHEVHKYVRRIRQPKQRDKKFVMNIPCSKSCLRYIRFFNPQLIIARPQVYLRKHGGSSQLVEQNLNPW
ncbi:hypothetical protein ERO13_A05G328108v2 [Gossypium hirsutum]|nr:hypothetical protein ERO13_A05G328108v2 [Gossypium hirsutum]